MSDVGDVDCCWRKCLHACVMCVFGPIRLESLRFDDESGNGMGRILDDVDGPMRLPKR